ncbi:MAG: hypothetical protein P4L84_17965 [Isosphaeraceae bacterium]|nr:hypothetical protein [Isosphaeraceae bacterium]
MDPIAAMLGGLGGAGPPAAGGPQGPPMGPDGFPIGGSLPPPDPSGGDEMGGSSLLQALAGAMGGDQYTQPPGAPDTMFQGIGQGDPNMGIEQLLSMLALGQMGVGGGPSPASSGVADLGPQSLIGQMVGLGR